MFATIGKVIVKQAKHHHYLVHLEFFFLLFHAQLIDKKENEIDVYSRLWHSVNNSSLSIVTKCTNSISAMVLIQTLL